jgi:hypothetical protein
MILISEMNTSVIRPHSSLHQNSKINHNSLEHWKLLLTVSSQKIHILPLPLDELDKSDQYRATSKN